ncbi:hypothetical protein IGI04_006093 [Brassica rapa subsp. trilocularis]|uniref:Uncharacterized protein n=1 Tax=Brassica rapa subsp. trilocularis TaxID=1813537 RepID=A0ABQ7NFY0_BRACM|nr:hypothetical protein IGI04_006093 [Brassica rapa subsp. trilocularis]
MQPEPNRQTSPCAGQRHQTSCSAGETSRDTARELEPSHALEEDDGNGESNANTGVALEHSFTVKPDFSVGSNLKPSAARKELRCPLVSTREPIQQRQLQQLLRASTMAEKVEESLCLEMKL